MCGIFGLLIKPGTDFPVKSIGQTLVKVATFSEARGKDSSGIAFRNSSTHRINVIKGDIPVKDLLKSEIFVQNLNTSIEAYQKGEGFAAFGHARLVTNGSQLHEVNNQPVLKDDMIIIHNGIIVNVDELWEKHQLLERKYSIDTEVIPSLIRQEAVKNHDLVSSITNACSELEGTFSCALMFQDLDQFVLMSNNGSLYYITDNENFIVFASEYYYLEQLQKERCFSSFNKSDEIRQVRSNQGIVTSLMSLKLTVFSLVDKNNEVAKDLSSPVYKLEKHLVDNMKSKNEVVIDPSIYINRNKEASLYSLLENNIEAIRKLRRCTKCLLPETFPFIEYDDHGVCNYCNNYKPKEQTKELAVLKELVEPYRRKDGKPDCIVPFSGGRDSTYTLHLVKKELRLNPIAFTYDWGMVTDLARRNIARVCGKLGVENIIVSADIRWKRENIRKNITAWLNNPSLGMIPLFMAGDKYFFYYCNKVKEQTGIDLNIWGINDLENTEFKTGFAGLRPQFDKKRIYSLSVMNQMKLFGYVAKNIIRSPGYINQSLLDSLGSYAVRYIAPKSDYYHLFDYYRWDEEEIKKLILNEYEWETAIDTKSTWRIGDGTASFYNYIYYTVTGFSENDTFRSNQIRQGMLDRNTALKLCEEDNIPRYETLRWYLDIIGLDFQNTINIINQIPKLYKTSI